MLQAKYRRLVSRFFILGALLGCLVMVTGKENTSAALSCDPEERYICQTSDDGVWYESCCHCAQKAAKIACEEQVGYIYNGCTEECVPWY
jgi:hypothetical protein